MGMPTMANARPVQPLPLTIDKLPLYCASPAEFQAGDILIFNINRNQQNANKHHTVLAQKMFNNIGGHEDAVHAAFVVESNGKKKIAHLRLHGFVLDEVDMIKTTTHIYRPRVHQKEIANALSAFIEIHSKEFNKTIKWKNFTAIFSFLRRLTNGIGIKNNDPKTLSTLVDDPKSLPTSRQFISTWSVYSKFLAQSYAVSCYDLTKQTQEDFRSELMNITTNTLPKTLQAYLYRCSNYQYLVMPHVDDREKITETLKQLVFEEVTRLKTGSLASVQKAQRLESEINAFFSPAPEMINPINDFDKAKIFLNNIIPILKINTNNNIRTSKSYTRVMIYAQSQGLRSEYFDSHLIFNSDSHDLTAEAQEAYKYDKGLAEKYSQYRQLGFSDEEARFECKPKLWGWMKINNRRNIAAAA